MSNRKNIQKEILEYIEKAKRTLRFDENDIFYKNFRESLYYRIKDLMVRKISK